MTTLCCFRPCNSGLHNPPIKRPPSLRGRPGSFHVNVRSREIFDNGTVIRGKLDGTGFARHDGVPDGSVRVEWGEDERPWGGETRHPNERVEAAPSARSAMALVHGLLS